MADELTSGEDPPHRESRSAELGPSRPDDLQEVEGEFEDDSPPRMSARMPTEVREMLTMIGQFGPAPSPVAAKLTSEHITKMLEIDRARLGHERESEKEGRWHQGGVLLLVCAFVLILVQMLLQSGNAQLTQQIINTLIGLVAGAAGGYGAAKLKRS